MRRPRVLFLCTHNACRSQMAEGWLRHLAGDRVEALSAGTAPSAVHPLAARVMAETGVDLSGQRSEAVEAHLADPPDVVVAVCDAAAERCPTLPGATRLLRWPFPDPAAVTGTEEEVLDAFRAARDAIRARIARWLEEDPEPWTSASTAGSSS